jgi:hypothetical protein
MTDTIDLSEHIRLIVEYLDESMAQLEDLRREVEELDAYLDTLTSGYDDLARG